MGQATEYTYYPNGLLKTVKDAKGQVTTYTYDTANRLTQTLYADGKTDNFTYDAAGNLTSYAKSGVVGTITYDELGRKLSETVNYGPFSKTYSYTYDASGNKATFTSPEGKVYSYTYNKNDQPTAISFDGKTIDLTYQWDRLTKAQVPNGVSTDYQYNANSWLAAINTQHGASAPSSNQYGFDKVGNITSKITEQGGHLYGYDSTYQLSAATNPVLPAETYSYDKTGNRLSATVGSDTKSYSHNGNNELTAAGGATYTYDANGNTTSKTSGGQTTTFIYNSGDRLETAQLPDGRTAVYTYDPFGRRIKKQVGSETTYFLYSDEGLIGEYDASGNLRTGYGWQPGGIWGTNPVYMTENNRYYFYQNDHLGTPQKVTDESGNIVWSAIYTAFGKAIVDPESTVINNLYMGGQYCDQETGLHYNWHRYYDSVAGRYTQVDPIKFGAGDANIYRYVQNNPNNWIDPLGYSKGGDKNINVSDDIGQRLHEIQLKYPYSNKLTTEQHKERQKLLREIKKQIDALDCSKKHKANLKGQLKVVKRFGKKVLLIGVIVGLAEEVNLIIEAYKSGRTIDEQMKSKHKDYGPYLNTPYGFLPNPYSPKPPPIMQNPLEHREVI